MFELSNQWFVVGIVSVIWWLFLYIKQKQSYWEKQGVKGPKPAFLIGNVGFSKPITDNLVDNYTKYGKVHGTYQGTNPHLIIAEPELLRQICVKDFHILPQGFEQNYLGPVERNFLTSLYGERWKRMRSTLSPTFTTRKMKKMFDLIKICNQEAKKELVKLTTSGDADFDPKYCKVEKMSKGID